MLLKTLFNKKNLGSLVVAGAMLAGSAQAALITVGDNHAGARFLTTQTVLNGSFDLRSHLDSNSTIDWARVTFSFNDDRDLLRYTNRWGSYYTGYTRRYIDEGESARISMPQQVSVGVGSNRSVTNSYSYRRVQHTSYRTETRRRSYRCGFLNLRTCYHYYTVRIPYTTYRTVRDTNVYDRSSGPFTASFLLNQNALLNLLDTGMAGFQVRSQRGDMWFRNAQLTASISQVAEPSTIALLGLGAMGLVWARRQQRQPARLPSTDPK